MNRLGRVSLIGTLSLLVLASGTVFAKSHQPLDHKNSAHEVIQGTVSASSSLALATGSTSFTITTSSGKPVTVALSPKTRIEFQAKGTEQSLFGGKAVIDVKAQVTSVNGTWTAQGIEARVVAPNKKGKDGQKDSHDKKGANHQDHKGSH